MEKSGRRRRLWDSAAWRGVNYSTITTAVFIAGLGTRCYLEAVHGSALVQGHSDACGVAPERPCVPIGGILALLPKGKMVDQTCKQ